jgi:hypothetical protein
MTKNKSKTWTLLGATMLMTIMSYAQSIAPQSVNSSGTKMTQVYGSLSFTVGELVVLSQTDSQGNTLGGGFTAGATLTTVSIQEVDAAILDVNVFPNPTSELLKIQINYSLLEQIIITISDLQGKELYNGVYAAMSNTIGVNTASYTSGVYILSIKDTNKVTIGTYKIIKK